MNQTTYYIPSDHIPILCIINNTLQQNIKIELTQKNILDTTQYNFNAQEDIHKKYIKYKLKYLRLKKYKNSFNLLIKN